MHRLFTLSILKNYGRLAAAIRVPVVPARASRMTPRRKAHALHRLRRAREAGWTVRRSGDGLAWLCMRCMWAQYVPGDYTNRKTPMACPSCDALVSEHDWLLGVRP